MVRAFRLPQAAYFPVLSFKGTQWMGSGWRGAWSDVARRGASHYGKKGISYGISLQKSDILLDVVTKGLGGSPGGFGEVRAVAPG